jgi:hypothetical protein
MMIALPFRGFRTLRPDLRGDVRPPSGVPRTQRSWDVPVSIRKTVCTGMAAAILHIGSVPAFAQDRPAEQDRVIVEGQSPEDRVRSFVSEIAAPSGDAEAARGRRSVCAGAVNLEPETAQYLLNRVGSVAAEIGLRPGKPGCKPEVIIVGVLNGEAVAEGLVRKLEKTLSPGGDFSRDRSELEAFATGARAVRWWHISTPVDVRSGQPVGSPKSARTGFDATGSKSDLPFMRVAPTLLGSPVRQDLLRAIVIVDVSQLGAVTPQQLADYLAFVSLAQVDPDADVSAFPSILNVFLAPDSVAGLTDWDRAYLQGLYRSDDAAISNAAREGDISREMLRAIEPARSGAQGD